MSASLAIVAVGNAAPALLGREGVVLTPVRLPIGYGPQIGQDWESTNRDPGRGDAVTGRFAGVDTDDALYLGSAAKLGFNELRHAMPYFSSESFSVARGNFVNYYA